MEIATILKWIITNRNKLFKGILSLSVGLLLVWGITLHKQNKKLSESLELAQNNIEAYQGIVNESQQANNVLKLSVDELQNSKDKLIHELDSVRKELKIKPKEIGAAATQTQIIYVNRDVEVKGDIIEVLKDTIYSDSIQFNPQTSVSYSIGKDTINIGLDIQNKQYLYIYSKKEYKNKKSFFKRLFTLDFKKVRKYKYEIVNSNDLIKKDSVRVIEITNQK